MNLNYSPIVDVRTIKNKEVVPEVSKYAVKDADYLIEKDNYNFDLQSNNIKECFS